MIEQPKNYPLTLNKQNFSNNRKKTTQLRRHQSLLVLSSFA